MAPAHAVESERVVEKPPARPDPRGRADLAHGTSDAPVVDAMLPFYEDNEDPNKPRPVATNKKRTGRMERGETGRKDDDRDGHRHVHVRC